MANKPEDFLDPFFWSELKMRTKTGSEKRSKGLFAIFSHFLVFIEL